MLCEHDSLDDIFREIIDAKWPGGKPAAKAREVVLGIVKDCMSEARKIGQVESTQAEMLTRVLAMLEIAKNPAMVVRCIKFCVNLEDESQTEIAEQFGVTRADVSRVCVHICKTLGIPPGRGMKSEGARESYRESAKESAKKRQPTIRHWTYKPIQFHDSNITRLTA